MNDRIYDRRFSERSAFWEICAAVLAAVCLYIFMKISAAGLRTWGGAAWIACCLAAAMLSFVARRTRLLKRAPKIRLIADCAGGLWFIFALWSFVLLFFAESVSALLGYGADAASVLRFSFSVSLCLVAFGVRGALNVCTTFITVETDKLPRNVGRLRIVQLTDLHLGPLSGVSRLAGILRRVRDAKPDVLVVTGDVTDGNLERRGRAAAMFRRVRPKYGAFSVTGNHDFYDGIDGALRFMRMSGMRVLRGEAVEAGGIVVEGVDDHDHLMEDKWGLTRSETVIVNTRSQYREKFILLLRHRPVVEIGTEGFFDLQLSGHTHGGQVFPLLSSRLFFGGHSRGLKKLKRGGALYTSNGAGYVGPPVRLFAPAEIVVIDLVRKEAAHGAAPAR